MRAARVEVTEAAARRGEAHLWLLLEEALVAIGRAGSDPWEVQRNFQYVSHALAVANVVTHDVVRTLRAELRDALVVRRIIPPASFLGAESAPPALPPAAGTDEASVWLEGEVERHLDLLVAYDPTTWPEAGVDAMRILGAPARAFEASGVLGEGRTLMADLAASIAAAGYDIGRVAPRGGRIRRDWVRFLRDRPPSIPDPHEPAETRHPFTVLGELDGRVVRVDDVAWSGSALEITLSLTPTGAAGIEDLTPWMGRALDDRGRVHLGQPSADVGAVARFRLRPGLEAGVRRLQLRFTAKGHRLEGGVEL